MNKAMLFSFLRVFFAAALAQYISNGSDIFSYTPTMWHSVVGAGVSATVLTVYNYLNPNDPRYGSKEKLSSTDKDLSEAGK